MQQHTRCVTYLQELVTAAKAQEVQGQNPAALGDRLPVAHTQYRFQGACDKTPCTAPVPLCSCA